ncbi:MAG TPA: DNA-directed RNA polymerase subunit beta, partial [Ruminococcus sp.]|nr:DNA-directed RNA polymerase subunit beta [Ruminococcus sp.]
MSFGKINEALEMPNLIEVQKNSYKWFQEEGLKEVFRESSAITDYNGNLVLNFTGYKIDETPKYSIAECKERDTTYAAPLRVTATLWNKETGDVKESEIFMGDFPLMTESGTFVINGAERVIVSQLVRSPGVYYASEKDKTGKDLFKSTIIPNRGAWLEYEMDSNDVAYVRIDKNRKIPLTAFIRALGVGTDEEITELFGHDERLEQTILQKDGTKNTNDALIDVYKKLRPGEPPTVESALSHINNLFFDAKRYDLCRFGRYKYNKKLGIGSRLAGQILSRPVVNDFTGEFMADAGETISFEKAMEIEQAGVYSAFVTVESKEYYVNELGETKIRMVEKEVKIIGNGMVDIKGYVDFDPEQYGINEKVSFKVLRDILENSADAEEIEENVKKRADELVPKHIILDDIFASISYFINLCEGVGTVDDIDHLGNRRIRSVGELLQNQFRIGFSRMERVIRERMNTQSQDTESITPQTLVNIRPITAAIKEFFGSSPLSQFMDQTNPLAELTHKRRLSALGPGGLSRDRAGFEVRDVHYSHYGRMCPIETPEGPNIGLIVSLAIFTRVNEYGFLEEPYRKVVNGKATNEVEYLDPMDEDKYYVGQVTEGMKADGSFPTDLVSCRHRGDYTSRSPKDIQYMDVSPRQVISVSASLVPFLEHDDANRALMGCNMQRQAVPLLFPEPPHVGTGMEQKTAYDSGVLTKARRAGTVKWVESDLIKIKPDGVKGDVFDEYPLLKYQKTNSDTVNHQRPTVQVGEHVEAGGVIADGPATFNGELALGRNILVGFVPWNGYNYEDAVLISQRVVKEDMYTSVHIHEFQTEIRETKLGPERITRDIPNTSEKILDNLDSEGIVRIGAKVRSGDILVGKVTPKSETETTPEFKLLNSIFGEKAKEVRDSSLKLPHGVQGVVIDIQRLKRSEGDELQPGVDEQVKVIIADKRKLVVGDKMAGRHGNKGVVSRVLPVEDMPFLPNGRPLDIVLNPLGVPSRMNIG